MEENKQYRLSELISLVKGVLDANLNTYFYVIGEISNYNGIEPNKHLYPRLIERRNGVITAEIKTCIFRGSVYQLTEFERKTGLKFENGIEVLLKVKVELHPIYGLSLIMNSIDHNYTLGKIQDEKLKTLIRLEKEKIIRLIEPGVYETHNKKLDRPSVIQRIALISSVNTKGYTDFKAALLGNKYGYKFTVTDFPATMQGNEAAKSMLSQLQTIDKRQEEYDAVAIIRGGGDDTGFICFDDYELSKAVANYKLPIITGIGHEQNKSIVDMVANIFTMVPAMAGKSIIEHNKDFENYIIELGHQIANASKEVIDSERHDLVELDGQLKHEFKLFIQNEKDTLNQLIRDVKNFSPENTLARGYAIITFGGNILNDTKQLKSGNKIKTITSSSIIESNITKIEKRNGNANL